MKNYEALSNMCVVKDGKFQPKIVRNAYGAELVAIGYNAKKDCYVVLEKQGWTLSDKDTVNYFDEYNIDERFRGCRVWAERMIYRSDEE